MGDFYQFPPVRGLPLWRQPREDKEDEQTGRDSRHQLTNVIMLNEVMNTHKSSLENLRRYHRILFMDCAYVYKTNKYRMLLLDRCDKQKTGQPTPGFANMVQKRTTNK